LLFKRRINEKICRQRTFASPFSNHFAGRSDYFGASPGFRFRGRAEPTAQHPKHDTGAKAHSNAKANRNSSNFSTCGDANTDTKIDRWRPDIGRSSTPAQTKGDT